MDQSLGGSSMNAVSLRAFRAYTAVELRLASRRYESILVTLVIPLLLLIFFASITLVPESGAVRRIDRLVPGILTISIIATGLVSLAISTAYDRGYGVLKRLAGSPLPRWALLAARIVVVVVTVMIQLVLVAIVGIALGWAPDGGPLQASIRALPWIAVGTIGFSAFGLLLAGRLRPELVLAIANGLFVVILLVGGVIVPLDQLPGFLAAPISLLPPSLLTELLAASLGGAGQAALDPFHAATLTGWMIALVALVVVTFRVEPE